MLPEEAIFILTVCTILVIEESEQIPKLSCPDGSENSEKSYNDGASS
jgi:hypothetical protein